MSKRFDILQAFYNVIEELENDEELRVNEFIWRQKGLVPFISVSPQKCPAFYVFDFKEDIKRESKLPLVAECELYIICEIWIQLNLSNEASQELNFIIEKIQHAFQQKENYRLNGLVQRVIEQGSEFKIISKESRIVSCEILFKLLYIRNAIKG